MTATLQGPGASLAAALGDPRARPDRAWLRKLLPEQIERIDATLDELAEYAEIESAVRAEYARSGREFYAQIRAPFELYTFTRLTRPEHVVETGVSSGVSSLHFLLALVRNRQGVLHSIDLPDRQKGPRLEPSESPVALPPGRDTGWVVPTALRSGWDLRLGPSQELLPPLLEEIPSVGLFLHDSLHTPTHLTFELETIRRKLVPGAVVMADNTQWTGKAFDRFASSLGVPFFRRRGEDLVGLRVPRSNSDGASLARTEGGRSPGRRIARSRSKR
ncbi:MAG TPA: class I SAM-dependent methyltransferase [Thermoplasmata archaeon]|nr:class I SAM-dependent methyltransferase [Thermoplasmata archaeon]